MKVELALATAACCPDLFKPTLSPAGAAVGLGTKKGVTTEVATETVTGIATEKTLMVGKVQEHHEGTENAPGAETETRDGQGRGKGSGTETDTANFGKGPCKHLQFHF